MCKDDQPESLDDLIAAAKSVCGVSGAPSPIRIGHYFDPPSGIGEANLLEGERNILLFGLNGAGKSTRILIELLATARGRSLVVFDVKGELAAQTAEERRKHGRVVILNPLKLHVERYPDLAGDVFNPLEFIDPDDDHCYSNAAAVAHAAIEIDPHEHQKFFPESAQGLLIALICWECVLAKRESRVASLVNVHTMLTEPEEWKKGKGGKEYLVKGLKLTIARMVDKGGALIARLVGEFAREHGLNEIASVISSTKTPLRWINDPLMRASLEGRGIDFRRLRDGDEPTTVYVILPAGDLTEFRPWSRMVISTALRAQYRPGRFGTLFVLDEFFAALGHMKVIEDSWALVRGWGTQLMPIVQSALQLKALFNDAWENFAAQAGAVITLGPPGDLFTAEWMSRRCGKTTVLQLGFNQGQGINNGHGFNAGSGTGGQGVTTNAGSGINFGGNISDGLSFQQAERPFLLPQELMDFAPGTGLIWTPGMGTRSIPFFAPNYWQRRDPWVARVRPNPYRREL